jgi:hypothetical protein
MELRSKEEVTLDFAEVVLMVLFKGISPQMKPMNRELQSAIVEWRMDNTALWSINLREEDQKTRCN